VSVNGKRVNLATSLVDLAGRIGLESERGINPAPQHPPAAAELTSVTRRGA
jgi:hypothetical protein